MERQRPSQAKRLAVCAILAGSSLAVLYVGALSGILDLCAVVVGAVCIVFTVIEIGGPYPWLTAAVTGTLCLLLLPDKLVALEYVALGGVYPILKAPMERPHPALRWTLKLLYFNGALTAYYLLATLVLHTEDFAEVLAIFVYLAGNLFFVVFDRFLTTAVFLYLTRYRKRFRIKGLK